MDAAPTQQERHPATFPKLEDARDLVRHREDMPFYMRVVLGWKPRVVCGAYWTWLTKWRTPRLVCLRLSGILDMLGLLISIILMLNLFGLVLPFGLSWQNKSILIPLALVLSSVAAYLGRTAKLHFARHVLKNEGSVCFECGYLLHGLPDSLRCPECSTPYTIEELRHRWLDWMTKPSM